MNIEDYNAQMTRRRFIRQAACAALGTAALTNTISDLRLINTAMAQTPTSDYKALVCIFLAGGNDSSNLIIPTTPEDYAEYARIRTPVLAVANTGAKAALPLNATDAQGKTYGVHPACPELQGLYNSGKLTTVFNVGTLVYPLTKAQYMAGSVPRPLALMSHGDQSAQWQTSLADVPRAASGWGGRCADLMSTLNPKDGIHDRLSLAISLAGNNIYEVGGMVQPYIVSPSGVVSLTAKTQGDATLREQRLKAMQDIIGMDEQHKNMLTRNYATALDHSLALGGSLDVSLKNSPLAAYWDSYPSDVIVPTDLRKFGSSLHSQLKMVAKIIDAGYRSTAQGGLAMKRQIFFCQIGGYDTHFNQNNNSGNSIANADQAVQGTQASLFSEISQGMNAFQNAMAKIGQHYGDTSFEKRVTAFTASDFGRCLASNGYGTDHGWGGHHLVMGGAVKGGKSYGKFPLMAVDGPDDIGEGRLLPSTSVDQFAATMAKWFGVTDSNLNYVFPNLKRFAVPNLGFMA